METGRSRRRVKRALIKNKGDINHNRNQKTNEKEKTERQ